MQQLPQSLAECHTNKLAVNMDGFMSIWTRIEAIGTNKIEPLFSMSDVSEPDCRVFRSAAHQSGLDVSCAAFSNHAGATWYREKTTSAGARALICEGKGTAR